MVATGRLGQKTGQGFFDWQSKRGKLKKQPSADVAELIKQHVVSPVGDDFNLTDRLMLPMLLEADTGT